MNKIFQIGYSPIKQGLQRDPTTSHSRLNHSTPLKIINLSLSLSLPADMNTEETMLNFFSFFFSRLTAIWPTFTAVK